MKRRTFITIIGGAMAANGTLWLKLAQAQTATPVVGVLSSGSLDRYTSLLAGFRQGLGETGYVDGRNVVIEARGAAGQFDRTTQLATELVQHHPAVLVATGNGSARATQAATRTIPLVFLSEGDPIQFGLVDSLSRPNGNATGVAVLASDLLAKRLDLVRQLAPAGSPIAVIINPKAPEGDPQAKEVEEAARNAGQRVVVLNASDADEIHAAFDKLKAMGAGALIVSTDSYLFGQRDRITALAIRHAIPAMYDRREFAAAGGLITYGTHYADAYRR